MDAPPVQYVKTSDGYSIAYAVRGEGTPLVFLPGVFDHVQLAWRYAGIAPWVETLSQRFQLVQLDPRGSGMSTRGLPPGFEFGDYLRDIEAVVDRLRLETLILCAGGPGAIMAALYAATYPHRVRAIIIPFVATSWAAARAPAVFAQLPAQDWDTFLYSVVPRDRSPEQAKHTVELLKQAYDQEDFVLARTRMWDVPIIDVLGELATPVLVMHSRDYALMEASEAMNVAQICGGRMVLIDGNTPFGDVGQAIHAIDDFLAELPHVNGPTAPTSDALSLREVEVLRLLAAGKSNQQIADELVISLNTVNRHVSNIYAKTGAANRAEAAAYATRNGIT
jgi:DNA-binding CsgD family transcriptional regulator/pimeloyl-ACP methyl ester carboxylesterase